MRSGMINVAAAAFWGIGAYATGLLMTKGGLTFWQSLPLAIIISFVLALVLPEVRLRTHQDTAHVLADDAAVPLPMMD